MQAANTKGKWRYASSKAKREMEVCKQQSEMKNPPPTGGRQL